MEEKETGSKVKPILRLTALKRDIKKRLSFAPTDRDSYEDDLDDGDEGAAAAAANITSIAEEFPRSSGTLPEAEKVSRLFPPDNSYTGTSSASDDEEMDTVHLDIVPVCKSLRVSPAGLYYVPSSRKIRQYSNSLPIIPLKENSRNIFKTTFDGVSSKTAKILILGNKCEGEKIRDNLISLKETQSNRWSLKWDLQLDIKVDDAPSIHICRDTNYFIFLMHLHALDSLTRLAEQLAKIRKSGTLPAACGIVLCMTTAHGICRNVITNENLANFFSDHCLPYIHWGKPDKDHYLKILQSIYDGLGYNSGLSLLTKSTLQWHNDGLE